MSIEEKKIIQSYNNTDWYQVINYYKVPMFCKESKLKKTLHIFIYQNAPDVDQFFIQN